MHQQRVCNDVLNFIEKKCLSSLGLQPFEKVEEYVVFAKQD
jgi:hypothetical protein